MNTQTPTSATLPASELAARAVEVAARLDAINLPALTLDVSQWSIHVQLADEDSVDAAAAVFEDAESAAPASESPNYTRVAFLSDVVTVKLYSKRTRLCACCATRRSDGVL